MRVREGVARDTRRVGCCAARTKPWECGPPEESGVPGMGEYDQAMVEREVAEKIEQYAAQQGAWKRARRTCPLVATEAPA